MHRLLREPLLHFFLLGALLFVLYGWLDRDGFDGPNEIVVSRADVENLAAQFRRVWGREPSPQELAGLIDNRVREEILYREGLAMGLDRDDPVVRRRVQQKLEFVVDSATPQVPTEDELQAWLEAHPDDYRIEARYALEQVYFDPAKHGNRLEATLASAKNALESGRRVQGDSVMLPAELQAGESEVIRSFGPEFEGSLRGLDVGRWQGPIRSGYGVHLVRLSDHVPSRPAQLGDARAQIERDLLDDRARSALQAFYERLREAYTVRIEGERPLGTAPTG